MEAAKQKLERLRHKAPADQQGAIDFALMLFERAMLGSPRKGEAVADWVMSRIKSNAEWDHPDRPFANKIILRLLG